MSDIVSSEKIFRRGVLAGGTCSPGANTPLHPSTAECSGRQPDLASGFQWPVNLVLNAAGEAAAVGTQCFPKTFPPRRNFNHQQHMTKESHLVE